jgi:hypothetical protein
MELDPKTYEEQQPVVTTVTDPSTLLEQEDSPVVLIRKQFELLRTNFMVLLAPGDKQFKDMSKRVRLMGVSFVVPLLYAIMKLFLFPNLTELWVWGLVSLGLGILLYVLTIWGLKGQIRKESFLSALPFPALFSFSYSIFLSVSFVGPVNRVYLLGVFLVMLLIFMVSLYIITLAINVLNVNLFYTIPLGRLGESVTYITSIVIAFLISYAVTATFISQLILQHYLFAAGIIGGYFLIIFIVTLALCLYFLPYQQGSVGTSIVLSLFLSLVCGLFAALMPYAWQSSLAVSLVAYILLGYIIHKEQNTLKMGVVLEFGIVLISLVILAIAL